MKSTFILYVNRLHFLVFFLYIFSCGPFGGDLIHIAKEDRAWMGFVFLLRQALIDTFWMYLVLLAHAWPPLSSLNVVPWLLSPVMRMTSLPWVCGFSYIFTALCRKSLSCGSVWSSVPPVGESCPVICDSCDGPTFSETSGSTASNSLLMPDLSYFAVGKVIAFLCSLMLCFFSKWFSQPCEHDDWYSVSSSGRRLTNLLPIFIRIFCDWPTFWCIYWAWLKSAFFSQFSVAYSLILSHVIRLVWLLWCYFVGNGKAFCCLWGCCFSLLFAMMCCFLKNACLLAEHLYCSSSGISHRKSNGALFNFSWSIMTTLGNSLARCLLAWLLEYTEPVVNYRSKSTSTDLNFWWICLAPLNIPRRSFGLLVIIFPLNLL